MLLWLVTPTSGMARISGRPYQELACPLRQVGVALESAGAHPAGQHAAICGCGRCWLAWPREQ